MSFPSTGTTLDMAKRTRENPRATEKELCHTQATLLYSELGTVSRKVPMKQWISLYRNIFYAMMSIEGRRSCGG